MPWARHTGPQPHASLSTEPCHGGRCPPLQLQFPAIVPGIAAPSMTIVSWARASRTPWIDGMADTIVAAMITRNDDT